jgi:hypothetical protein
MIAIAQRLLQLLVKAHIDTSDCNRMRDTCSETLLETGWAARRTQARFVLPVRC